MMETNKALDLAREKNLDVVEVAPAAKPPVAKLLNFKQFVLDQKKKLKKVKAEKKIHKIELKEVRIKPNIGEGDLTTRAKQIEGFLKKGNRVKLTVFYRGREVTHPEVGLEKVKKLIEMLQEVAKVEESPTQKKRTVEALLSPKKNA